MMLRLGGYRVRVVTPNTLQHRSHFCNHFWLLFLSSCNIPECYKKVFFASLYFFVVFWFLQCSNSMGFVDCICSNRQKMEFSTKEFIISFGSSCLPFDLCHQRNIKKRHRWPTCPTWLTSFWGRRSWAQRLALPQLVEFFRWTIRLQKFKAAKWISFDAHHGGLWICFCEPVFVKPLVNTTSLRRDWINLAWLWVAGKLFALKIIPGACYLAFTKYSSRLLMDANTNCIFLESHFCRISQSTLFFLLVKK